MNKEGKNINRCLDKILRIKKKPKYIEEGTGFPIKNCAREIVYKLFYIPN